MTPLYDASKPVIDSVSGNPTSWTNQDVTLTVNATDVGDSGIASYSFDNGNTWQTTKTKKFQSNQTVNIKVKDNTGNESDVTTIVISKIDKDSPSISSVTKNPTSWTAGPVTLSVTATDTTSAIE